MLCALILLSIPLRLPPESPGFEALTRAFLEIPSLHLVVNSQLPLSLLFRSLPPLPRWVRMAAFSNLCTTPFAQP